MIVNCFSANVVGINASLVKIEISSLQGSGLTLMGLPESAVQEILQRVGTALENIGHQIPQQKTLINLLPLDVYKESYIYDLPVTIGLLIISQQIKLQKNLEEYLIVGEFDSHSKLKPSRGVLPMAIEARRNKFKGIIVPLENVHEAAIVNNIDVIGVESLQDAIVYLSGSKVIEPLVTDTREIFSYNSLNYELDFSQVEGQESIKRGLEIAAAGGHNVIISGSSGTDKLSISRRFSSILPPLSLTEALEVTKIYSALGKLPAKSSLIAHRPFKILYHTTPETILLGGGASLHPGEITLGHTGTVFLEELSEFPLNYQNSISELIKDKKIKLEYGQQIQDIPINVLLIASFNNCPCGNYKVLEKKCTCSKEEIKAYLKNLSPLLLDTIDIHIEVDSNSSPTIRKNESSEEIRRRVLEARTIQSKRFKNYPNIQYNTMIPSEMVQEICQIDTISKILLTKSMERLGLSDKNYNHILKIARTIADLAGSEEILMENIAEAIQFRSLVREN